MNHGRPLHSFTDITSLNHSCSFSTSAIHPIPISLRLQHEPNSSRAWTTRFKKSVFADMYDYKVSVCSFSRNATKRNLRNIFTVFIKCYLHLQIMSLQVSQQKRGYSWWTRLSDCQVACHFQGVKLFVIDIVGL